MPYAFSFSHSGSHRYHDSIYVHMSHTPLRFWWHRMCHSDATHGKSVSHESYQKNLPWPQLLLCGPPPRSTRDHSPAPPLLSPATQHRSTLRWRVLIQLQPPLPRSAPPVALQRGLWLIKQGVLDISIMPIPLYASHMLDLHLLAIQTSGYKVI